MAYSNRYFMNNDGIKIVVYNEGYQEGYAFIDFDDEPSCKRYTWYVNEHGVLYTYKKSKNQKSMTLHRYIVRAKDTEKVFFNDRNKHNCRKDNLTVIDETGITNRYVDNYDGTTSLNIYSKEKLVRFIIIDNEDVQRCKNYIWKIGNYDDPVAYTEKGITSLSRFIMNVFNSNIWVCFHDKDKNNCRKGNMYLVNSITGQVIQDTINSYEFKDRNTVILYIYDEIGNKYSVSLDKMDRMITCNYQWKYDSINRVIYGYSKHNQKVLLDKVLTNSLSDNVFIYHIDNDIFNCRKRNLLICTTTGFNNIYYNPTNQMYMLVQFNRDNNRFEYSGRFTDIKSAVNYKNRINSGRSMLKYI